MQPKRKQKQKQNLLHSIVFLRHFEPPKHKQTSICYERDNVISLYTEKSQINTMTTRFLWNQHEKKKSSSKQNIF